MTATNTGGGPITGLHAAAYRIPTDNPEADGTFAWDATTLVVVTVEAGNKSGLGYTYADSSIVALAHGALNKAIDQRDSFDIPGCWMAMQRSVRNLGRSGLAACAISAIDTALWDLKARALGVPLAALLGHCRDRVPIYGSGGFTTYSDTQLREQLSGWVERDGCRFVKMKIGSEPDRDPERVMQAKSAIGDRELFVDANGAFSVKEALDFADACADADIRWFEEPVTSDDLPGLRLMRERAPDSMDIAAGEYTYTSDDARRMLAANAIDVLQADATRCGGITGFLQVGVLCEAHHIDLSGHCAPAIHRHVACAVPRLRHLEWFHDHVRIEQMLFDGAPAARDGAIEPDLGRPGHGLAFKQRDAERFRVNGEPPVSRADTALDLIANAALAGAAVAILMRPRHVSRIAASPLIPKGRDFARWAARRVVPRSPPPRPSKAQKLARLVSRYSPAGRLQRQDLTRTAGRRLNASAALLALSVLADSAVEHYRGSFQNRAMYTPLVAAALTLGVSLFGAADARAKRHVARDTVYASAAATGFAGLGFHSYNILKRPGHWSWLNLFYAAPIGAPMALALAGLLGRGAERVRDTPSYRDATVLGLPAGRMLAAVTAAGLSRHCRRSRAVAFPRRLSQPRHDAAGDGTTGRCGSAWRIGAAPQPNHASSGALVATAHRPPWIRRGRIPRLWRVAQHGRLAQLVAERAERSAAAGAAKLYRTGAGRARRTDAHRRGGNR